MTGFYKTITSRKKGAEYILVFFFGAFLSRDPLSPL